jgi:hypothetical protein
VAQRQSRAVQRPSRSRIAVAHANESGAVRNHRRPAQ